MSETRTAVGRPRNEETTRAILDAALAVIDEDGYAGCSMERIAQRAGVQKPAVYRRWCNKAELVADAVQTIGVPITDPDTGNLEQDLTALLQELVATTRTPEGRVALRMLVEQSSDAELVTALRRALVLHRRKVMTKVLRRAAERGEIRNDYDLDVVVQMLLGPVMLRLLVKKEQVPAHVPGATARVLVAGLRP